MVLNALVIMKADMMAAPLKFQDNGIIENNRILLLFF
jgi:hypothetical protein